MAAAVAIPAGILIGSSRPGYRAMRALQEVGFRGVVIPDHIPPMADDPRLGTAYTIGYMKALLKRAEDEVGVQPA